MSDDQTTPEEPLDPENTEDLAATLKSAADQSHETYVLTMYITGMRSRSQRAIENVRRLCEKHLPGRYELQIIDIYQQPSLAQDAQIVAAPTLVKRLPPPLRRVIGDMSDDGRVLVALGVKHRGDQLPIENQSDSPS